MKPIKIKESEKLTKLEYQESDQNYYYYYYYYYFLFKLQMGFYPEAVVLQ
jgi:hypothetical protein